jgi:hypothetical protein
MTVTYYSVVKFIPDPLSGESVNIGLIVFSPEGEYGRAVFDDSERRARRIAPGANLAFLDQVERELRDALPRPTGQKTLGLAGRGWDSEALWRLSRDSQNVLQFSEPLASTEEPERLVHRLKEIYLPALAGRSRSRDALAVRRHVRRDLVRVGLSAWLRDDFEVKGRHDRYRFDIAVVRNGNGSADQLIESMTLAKADTEATRRELDALGYALYDLRNAERTGPVALVVAPDESRTLVKLAGSILDEFDAEVVIEDAADNWAAALAERLAATPTR